MMLAVAVAGTPDQGEASFGAWRRCIGETARVAAQAGRLPEEMPLLLHDACPDQRRRYLKASGLPDATQSTTRIDTVVADYLRRYAYYSSTGVWPAR
jgi:hypothetical protein